MISPSLRAFAAWRPVALAVAIIGAGMAAPPPAGAVQVVPQTLEETVQGAGCIFEGRVTNAVSRWSDPSHRSIVTDYTFIVKDAPVPSGAIQTGRSVTLTFWGGTLDGETRGIAGMALPKVGEDEILMLDPAWRSGGFSPVFAMNEGLFRIAGTNASAIVTDADRQPLRVEGGRLLRPAVGAPGAQKPVTLREFKTWLRNNAKKLRSRPPAPPRPALADPEAMQILRLKPEARSGVDTARAGAHTSSPVSIAGDLPAYPAMTNPGKRSAKAPAPGIGERYGEQPPYIPFGYCNAPIVVNSFPSSFAPWYPEDQYQMSKWNEYSSDLFRVYTTPTGDYGWPNNRFDLAGWPSSGDLQSMYGSGWGANVLGVCFFRQSGALILEADIALNPAFTWTLNDEAIYAGTTTAQSFRSTMLHELGHMLGLDHQFNFLSIMNYSGAPYRGLPFVYMDDAQGVRAIYPSRAVSRTDLGIYMYYSAGTQNWQPATFPSSVSAGGTLTVSNYHLENVGTTNVSAPAVEWYLTDARNFGGTYYFLGETTYSALNTFTYFTPSTVSRTLNVPASVPAGSYYLGAFIRVDGGYGGNSFAFTRTRITVSGGAGGGDGYEPDDSAGAAKTIGSGQTQNRTIHASGNVDWAVFTLANRSDVTIATNGGSGDTLLYLYGPNSSTTLIAEDDDSGPDLFSLIERTGANSLAAGTYYILVTEYGNNDTIPAYTLSLSTSAQSSITLTSPNGGETWTAGTTQNITWTSSGVSGNVKIEYSTNAGSTWATSHASTSNDGSEPFTVPNLPGTQWRVRVSSLDNPAINDASNANFTVIAAPTITVTAPNGGQSWQVGSSQNVTWTSSNVSGNVKLEYSTNGGSSWTVIQASTANDGSESWTVPNSPTTQGRIRVSSVNDGNVNDISDANFTITSVSTITVLSPNGGESWSGARTITWTSSGVSGNVKLEYSTDGGSNWTIIQASTANDGSEAWTVPNSPTTQGRVRVSSVNDGSVYDTSDANFTIPSGPLASFRLADGSVRPTQNVTVNLAYTSNGAQVASGRLDLLFDSSKLTFVSATGLNLPAGVSVTANTVSAGRVRLLVAGLSTTAWSNGNVLSTTFTAAAGITGSATVQVVLPGTSSAGVEVSSPAGVSGSADAQGSTISVVTRIRGDINGDNVVNIGDLTALAAVLLGQASVDVSVQDLNGDNVVNIGDFTTLASILLGTGTSVPPPGAGSPVGVANGAEFHLANARATTGGTVAVPLQYRAGTGAVTAGRLDLVFDPTQVTFTGSTALALPSGVTVRTHQVAPGRVRVLIGGLSNVPWRSGNVLSANFRLSPGVAGASVRVLTPDTNSAGVEVSGPSGAAASAAARGNRIQRSGRGR